MVTTGELDRRTKQLGNDVVAIHGRINDFRTEARERLGAVESVVRANTVQVGRLTEQVAGHDRQFERVTGILDVHTDQLEHLDHQMVFVGERLGSLESRVGGLEDKVSGLEDKVSGLDAKVGGLQGQMHRLLAHFGLDDSAQR
jgi:uncharacterized coiled-coil protein SlyX